MRAVAWLLILTACSSTSAIRPTVPSTIEPATTITTTTLPTSPPPSTTVEPSTTTSTAIGHESNTQPPIGSPDTTDWTSIAELLGPVAIPSDCGIPYDEPASMPNSPREYRGGTHQGIDFICMETGRIAVAALPGRVVVANTGWVEPTTEEREAVLDVARELQATPPWILAMLYGRFVVIDHGIVEGVGHVTTIYAHFASIDTAITPGSLVVAGQAIGEIGNTGTATAAASGNRPQSLHLHWELHIEGAFLGQGLGPTETTSLYRQLFDD